jgi:hypothetical protein
MIRASCPPPFRFRFAPVAEIVGQISLLCVAEDSGGAQWIDGLARLIGRLSRIETVRPVAHNRLILFDSIQFVAAFPIQAFNASLKSLV